MIDTSLRLCGRILSGTEWVAGEIIFSRHIENITGKQVSSHDDDFILPGFIDLHVHGGGGHDLMEAADAVAFVAQAHARFGTTSFLATTMTASEAEIAAALEPIGKACKKRPLGAARVLGVHLEGPYINPAKLGAQPDCVRVAHMAEIKHLHAIAPIKVLTLAPELSGHIDVISALTEMGIRVQLGHTLANYEEIVSAIDQGASSFTHLFNAMSPLTHREPGAVGAAFAHAKYSELIPDLIHVHPGAIKAALRAIPKLYCVTDSTAAAGMPDGSYMLGTMKVHKCFGGVRLTDGTLAGSSLTMDQALRNLHSLGLSIANASDRVSRFPAEFLGLSDRGQIKIGYFADLVVLSPQLKLKAVYVEGEKIELRY